MSTAPLVLGVAACRGLLGIRTLAAAVGSGLLVGGLVLGLPAPSLVEPVFAALVATFAGLLVLPLAAAGPALERAGGVEALIGLRPVGSLGWGLARLVGTLAGSVVLVAVIASSAELVAERRLVPHELGALAMGGSTASHGSWRFPLPTGSSSPTGTFDLVLGLDAVGGSTGELTLGVARGNARRALSVRCVPARHVTCAIPDLSPERGDLFVELDGGPRVVLSAAPPTLVIGEQPLGGAGLAAPRRALATLGLALLASVATACAFRFETACLAGLLALLVRVESGAALVALVVLLVGTAILGTALQRRQALP